jgi:hypothetical protein
VVTARASDTTAATDFDAISTNKNASERVFEYAPNGHRSGLCIDDASWSGLVLRQCNKGTQQQFYGLGDTQDDQGNTNNGRPWSVTRAGLFVREEAAITSGGGARPSPRPGEQSP